MSIQDSSRILDSLILRVCVQALRLQNIGRFVIFLRCIPFFFSNAAPPATRHSKSGERLKLIAAGFGRTGTTSLQSALDSLGFRCYHGGYSMFFHASHPKLWLQAAKGKLDDWQRILEGYTALVDYPAACFYMELMTVYPNAKVILNIRDPEDWYQSCLETIYRATKSLWFRVFFRDLSEATDVILWSGKFDGKFEDKEFAKAVYTRHIEEVQKYVPKKKLLVYEVKDGWQPLCDFLEVEAPCTRFPFANEAGSFPRYFRQLLLECWMCVALLVMLISCTLSLTIKWFYL